MSQKYTFQTHWNNFNFLRICHRSRNRLRRQDLCSLLWHQCPYKLYITFIFDTAIDDPVWKNSLLSVLVKTKTGDGEYLWEYDVYASEHHNLIWHVPSNCIFHAAIYLHIDFGDYRSTNMAFGGHFENKNIEYLSEMARTVINFRASKMGADSHFKKNIRSCVLIWNDEKCNWKWLSDIQNGSLRAFCEKK